MLDNIAWKVCKCNTDATFQNVTQTTLDACRQKLITTDCAEMFQFDDVNNAYTMFIKKI